MRQTMAVAVSATMAQSAMASGPVRRCRIDGGGFELFMKESGGMRMSGQVAGQGDRNSLQKYVVVAGFSILCVCHGNPLDLDQAD